MVDSVLTALGITISGWRTIEYCNHLFSVAEVQSRNRTTTPGFIWRREALWWHFTVNALRYGLKWSEMMFYRQLIYSVVVRFREEWQLSWHDSTIVGLHHAHRLLLSETVAAIIGRSALMQSVNVMFPCSSAPTPNTMFHQTFSQRHIFYKDCVYTQGWGFTF